MRYKIILGDSLEVMDKAKPESVDSIVTDPPYGIEFMGRFWDKGIPGVAYWENALRVAKPGAFLLAFGGTRTHHRLMCAIENAGWELRDTLMWVYGSGFPKSQNVSKFIDNELGCEGEIIAKHDATYEMNKTRVEQGYRDVEVVPGVTRAPCSDEAKRWEGWGTALKPAWEPIIMARKPLIGTVAKNVLAHGTGAINIDASRIDEKGRWPANVIHDGSPEVLAEFPITKSGTGAVKRKSGSNENGNTSTAFGTESRPAGTEVFTYGDKGSAARFFYCAKASPADREDSKHPTIKPTALMRYLVKLVTPPGGVVLDPFCGSGSTGKAAMLEGLRFVGIDLQQECADDTTRRCQKANEEALDQKA